MKNDAHSSTWQWGALFSADVPDNWTVHEHGGTIELTPAAPVGALHITFLRRTGRGDVQAGEAASLLTRFAKDRRGSLTLGGERHDRRRLLATGTMLERTRLGEEMVWDVHAQVWTSGALVCTYCHDGQHESERQEALSIMASLRPRD
jgi:hypothetical protein